MHSKSNDWFLYVEKHWSLIGLNCKCQDLNPYPTPGRYNKIRSTNDIETFTERIKLKSRFRDQVYNPEERSIKTSNRNGWTASKNHHTLETYNKKSRGEPLWATYQ